MTEPDNRVVFVVDDDASLRESLKDLIGSVGLRVEAFASAQEFLRSKRPDGPACLVLDVRLKGLSGLDLQKRMIEGRIDIPIVFITGHGDIPMTVQAMKAGAVEFLTKPFRDQDLLDAIQQALERDCKARERRAEIADLRGRFDSLTPREREVMALVAAGLLNKHVAGELGTSEASVKVHRQHVMEKIGADSLAELVRMADKPLADGRFVSSGMYSGLAFSHKINPKRGDTYTVPSVPLISIVDDDEALRNSLDDLLQSIGFRTQGFASADAFLSSNQARDTACLILDVRMPGMNGLDLQSRITAASSRIPIIFITSYADDVARARALEAGAVAFLYKPFCEEELLNAIDAALKHW